MGERASSWAVVGPGMLGQELIHEISGDSAMAEKLQLKPNPDFVVTRDDAQRVTFNPEYPGVYTEAIKEKSPLTWAERRRNGLLPDVTFVTLPPTDSGAPAMGFLEDILNAKKWAITAEKGALARYFAHLSVISDNFGRLGYTATVGGGTRLIDKLRLDATDLSSINELHVSPNGTLIRILSAIAPADGSQEKPMSLKDAVAAAQNEGLAEPGDGSPYDIIRGEAEGDVPKKISILLNALDMFKAPISSTDLKYVLEDAAIEQALKEAANRRFVASIYPVHNQNVIRDVIGGQEYTHKDWPWRIVLGFARTRDHAVCSHLGRLTGAGNGYAIGLGKDNEQGIYTMSGNGAGAKPTVKTMREDLVRMNAVRAQKLEEKSRA